MSTNGKIKCGDIFIESNGGKSRSDITFCCAFCEEESKHLFTFLNHIMVHYLLISKEEFADLLAIHTKENALFNAQNNSGERDEPLAQDSYETIALEDEQLEDDSQQVSLAHNHPTKYSFGRGDSSIEDVDNVDEAQQDNSVCHGVEFISFDPAPQCLSFPKTAEKPQLEKQANANENQAFTCGECQKQFRKHSELRRHKKKHISTNYCGICGVAIGDASNFKVHMQRHLGIKNFTCSVCEKQFVTTSELKIHKRSHTGEKPYKCAECGRSYKNASHFADHRRTHNKERLFVCPTCGKRFFTLNALRSHESIHKQQNAFKCESCPASFSQRQSLKAHMKLHSGIKEYKCGVCSKEFAQYAGLYSHMKLHRKNNIGNDSNK